VLREAVAVGVFGVFFLQLRGIRQNDSTQILRTRGAEDASAKSLCDKARQVSAVIEVRVRQNDGFDARGGNRQVLPVAQAQFLETLKQPRVDHDARPIRLDEVLRAGYRPRRTQKRYTYHPLFSVFSIW